MTAWVFLRGLTRESRHWGDFPAIFRGALPDARVYALDLPGNGRLHRQPSPLTVEEMAQSCRQQLHERGVSPPYHVLALSLGAMVAVAWASRYPGEICGCVLINTSLRPFSPFHRRLKPGSYFSLLGLLMGRRVEDRERAILRLTSRRAECHGETLNSWIAYGRENPMTSGNALRQVLAAMRYRAPLAKPAPPMLFLASRNDALVDPCCSRQLAALWKIAYAEHPAAGHDLPLDDGPWVAGQVSRWMQAFDYRQG